MQARVITCDNMPQVPRVDNWQIRDVWQTVTMILLRLMAYWE
jgi:hypothetical protein